MPVRSADLLLLDRLCDAAGAAIRPFFRGVLGLENKDDGSPVTLADRAAEAAMRRLLDAEAPGDAVVGEEYGEKTGVTGRTWVLDPIDGTRSFTAGRPIFGVLVALLEDGWPVMGAIDQPILRERWTGAAGRPTLLNGAPARTRPCPALGDALLASTGPQYLSGDAVEPFRALATASRDVVWGGDCYNYGLLASGHLDLVCEAGLKLHDVAALVPVVEGAGGRMCDWNGDPLTRDSEGHVLALGDPARTDDALEALHGHGH
jgi:histidinol phosphatase-like enzyme (inositol monophosphatase family)